MRDILVLSARANDFNLISQAVDKTHKIKDAKDIETAIALHNHFPFDLIIADLDLLEQTFGNIWITLVYLVWFAALWFHLTHGFWSAFQTLGANNSKWLGRLKVVSYLYSTVIALGFSTIAIFSYLKANGII